jgi:hypothetical protein
VVLALRRSQSVGLIQNEKGKPVPCLMLAQYFGISQQ